MRRFHGDLLMGGVAIRELDGLLDDVPDELGHHQEGSFEVDAEKQSWFELGRRYLLVLDNGDAVPVVVRDIDETRDHAHLTVQFESTG